MVRGEISSQVVLNVIRSSARRLHPPATPLRDATKAVIRYRASSEPRGCGCRTRPGNAAPPTFVGFRRRHRSPHAGFGYERAVDRSIACAGLQDALANRSSRWLKLLDNGTSCVRKSFEATLDHAVLHFDSLREERCRFFRKIPFLPHPGQLALQRRHDTPPATVLALLDVSAKSGENPIRFMNGLEAAPGFEPGIRE